MIPNGAAVVRNGMEWPAVGHTSVRGGVGLNPFGTDFETAGEAWSAALCQADSDGDGQSNGLELGDPGCIWTPGAMPARSADISHPGFSDSMMGTEAIATTTPATTTSAPVACTPSQLSVVAGAQGAGALYACSMQVSSDLWLHWRINQTSAAVDLALVKQGTGSWLSLAFPQQARLMSGGHAVVGQGVVVQGWSMLGYEARNFEALALTDMRAPVSSATAGAESGRAVLRLSGVRVADVRSVELLYGSHDSCNWPCQHGVLGSLTADLTSGVLAVDKLADNSIALIAAGLGLLALAAGAIAAVHLVGAWGRQPWKIMQPGRSGWSPAGAAAVVGVLPCLAVAVAVPFQSSVGVQQELVIGWGVASGLAASLPLWLAFWKTGLHSALLLSREAAWRIHSALGLIFLACATVHGALAIQWKGIQAIIADNLWLLGFVALLLMWLGALPALGHALAPRVVKYDLWKVLHTLSACGYVLCIAHVAGQVTDATRGVPLAITIINVLALVALLAQKLAAARAPQVLVESMEVISEETGRHVMLELDAPHFRYSAGQWARLHVPGASGVSHPFTIVPGARQGTVSFIIKVSGSFTAALARQDLQGRRVHLDGPYGLPPVPAALPWARTVVFVLGGVGVTPALSLAAAASSGGAAVRLFWRLRSPGLLRRCLPLLQPHVPPEHLHVQLSGVAGKAAAEAQAPADAPSGARQSVGQWLAAVAAERAAAGDGGPALLFICGPAGLAAAAREGAAAAARAVAGAAWQVHEEQFLFLPRLRPAAAGPAAASGAAAKVAVHATREGA